MNRRNFLAFSFSVGTAVLLAGCGGGGGKIALPGGVTPSPGSGGTPGTSGRGGITGYVFRDSAGRLQVGYTSTAPPGATPAAGVQIVATNDSTATAVSGANGAFHLESVPAGLGTLRLTPASGGAPLEVPLTVIKDAVIQIGAPPVARDKAVEAARTALASADLGSAVICATQQPLPAGVTIRSAEDNIAGATDGYVTPAPQWLVFADLMPGAQFGHPTRFCLVDAATGTATVQEQSFWPVVNGAHYYMDAALGADTADVVQGQKARAITSTERWSVSTRAVHAALSRAQREGTTRALVVKGWPRWDFKGDTLHIPSLFGAGGLPGSTPVVLEPPSADKQTILNAWSQVCSQATMDDVVFFFLSTHGSEKGYALLSTNIRAPDGTPDEDRNPVASGGDYLIEHLLPSDLIPAMADCLACEIILIVETCYSGFWITTMQAEASAKLQPCTTLTVLTATDSTHVGWGDTTPNTGGSLYINQLVSAYGQIAGGTPAGQSVSLFQVHNRASAVLQNSPSENGGRDQNPQLYQRTPEAGMVCGVAFSPTSASVEPKDLKTVDFTAQVCGQQAADGKYRYEFTTTGRQGVILSTTNTTGSTSITSDHAIVGYLAKSDAEEGQTDDIKVRVLTNDGTNRLVGTAKTTVTIGKPGDYVIESFTVDDNMTLWLNGTVIAGDQDGAYAGSRGPFTLTGSKKGDTIRLQVRDWYGFYASCSDVYIRRPDGTRRQWITGFQEQTPQGTHKVILDQTTTLD